MEIKRVNGRVVLTASEGMRVTDGMGNYGRKIILAVGVEPIGAHEITYEEYEAMQPKVEEGVE